MRIHRVSVSTSRCILTCEVRCTRSFAATTPERRLATISALPDAPKQNSSALYMCDQRLSVCVGAVILPNQMHGRKAHNHAATVTLLASCIALPPQTHRTARPRHVWLARAHLQRTGTHSKAGIQFNKVQHNSIQPKHNSIQPKHDSIQLKHKAAVNTPSALCFIRALYKDSRTLSRISLPVLGSPLPAASVHACMHAHGESVQPMHACSW